MNDGITPETGIPRLWDNAVPVSGRTGEYTKFIPPHPSTGQRNQFQFQGAIQALPITQVGRRSQSVGQSQGQIRVAQWKRDGLWVVDLLVVDCQAGHG